MIAHLIKENRTCRRFYGEHAVELETLKELINLGRLSASAGNLQPLKYIISCNPKTNAEIFSCLTWAAYLKDWPGPEKKERPTAYIIILGDTHISNKTGCDHGIAAQSIMLGAREKGLAGCMFATVNRKKLVSRLHIPSYLNILLVLALGKPKETVVLEAMDADGSVRYWRDDDAVHHVPKRKLEDIIICEY